MKTLLLLIALLVYTYAQASENNEFHLGKFSANDMKGWKEQTIGLLKPKTTYNLVKDNDKTVLVAHSVKSASGRIYNLSLDPKEYQTLKWSWKIDHTIKKGDEKTKDGEDFAARVYVIFPRGFFSKTRSICYVWANKLPKGEYVASPFTPNIITVAVDSGEEQAGHWTLHERNVLEDYKKFFGEEPPKIGAVALMTDTDNTGESVFGYYGDISLIRSPKAVESKHKDQKTKETPPKEAKPKDKEKEKELPAKGIKGNSESPPAVPESPKQEKAPHDLKIKEPNSKEQPSGVTTPLPTAAPQPPVTQ